MDKETLYRLKLEPGQIKENITTQGIDLTQAKAGQVFLVGDEVTMEVVGECEACGKMDEIKPGLREGLGGQRGMLAMVVNGGAIKIGDMVRIGS
jgi:MOSC domain-containing protein YiiM